MFNRFVSQVLRPKGRPLLRHSSKLELLSSFLSQSRHPLRCLSSAEPASKTEPLISNTFRTNESDPRNHSASHLGMFYTIPSEMANKLFVLGGFDKEQQAAIKTFKETAIMVRRPALEVFDYLNKADYSRPVNRYVLCNIC